MNVEKNWLEWIVFGVSVVILLGFVGSLGYLLVVSGDRPADLVVELGTPQEDSAGFRVPVRVRNRGDRTAEEVKVVVTLEPPGQMPEERELTFAFLPRRSERAGVVVFDRDPRCCRLAGDVASYERP